MDRSRRRLLRAIPTLAPLGWAASPAAGAMAQSARDAGASATGRDAPTPGRPGKDVMWLPTPEAMVARMLRMAGVGPADYVVDLGAGDGRIAIAAARDFGARALGIEFDPAMVEVARRRAREAGVAGHARFERADIFESDFSSATVVTLYLLPVLNLKLRPALLRMRPGTRIVSYAFDMGEWMPDETSRVGAVRSFLWRVPASVEGTWTLERDAGGIAAPDALALEQRFQRIGGEARFGDLGSGLVDPALDGKRIAFTVRDGEGRPLRFTGTVDGDRMDLEVFVPGGERGRFRATRATPAGVRPEAAATPEEQQRAFRLIGE